MGFYSIFKAGGRALSAGGGGPGQNEFAPSRQAGPVALGRNVGVDDRGADNPVLERQGEQRLPAQTPASWTEF